MIMPKEKTQEGDMDAQKTHFADDETLKHIDRLQAINAELVAALGSIKGCADALVGLQPNLAQMNKICAIANLARAALCKAKGE